MENSNNTVKLPRTRQGRRNRRVLYGVGAATTLLVAAAATVWIRGASAGSEPKRERVPVQTVAIVRTDLSTDHTLTGSLGFGTARPVRGGREGVVTWLPAVGTSVKRGQTLYRVNDEPVPLFIGSPPLYRTLSTWNTVGRAVAMVATNLKALGYSIGTQPDPGDTVTQIAPPDDNQDQHGQDQHGQGEQAAGGQGDQSGSGRGDPSGDGQDQHGTGASTSGAGTPRSVKVRDGDGVLTTSLIKAIKKWQRDHGLPDDGTLEVGDVAVLSAPVRVDSLAVAIGDSATGQILSVTSTTKVVTVQADVAEAGGLEIRDAATIRLPDGTETPGTVSAISKVAQTGADDAGPGSAATLAVTITLKKPSTVRRLDGADVEVNVAGETHTDVLAVPVNTLVALREGGYAVQLENGRLLAVETGLFARGMVEITGIGLSEGLKVVTTS